MTPSMTIAISGATGLIGGALSRFFKQNGCVVISLSRTDMAKGAPHLAEKMKDADVVINLAGAPILKRWTPAYKQEILNSRIKSTQLLTQALHIMPKRPRLFISTSAVGIYNNIDIHDEFSELYADTFLGDVCRQWEQTALHALNIPDVRLVIFRLGVVLSRDGGAFPQMAMPFRFFMGGCVGTGKQWFPFIHIKDVLSAFWFVCINHRAQGIYNLTAPQNITNHKFSTTLGETMHRPVWLPVPQKMLQLMYGDAATVLTDGQYVKTHRLVHDGFMFEFPTIAKTLQDLLSK